MSLIEHVRQTRKTEMHPTMHKAIAAGVAVMAPTPRRITGMEALTEFSVKCGRTVAELVGESRARSIAWPRQAAFAYVRERCPHLSLPRIGALFGGRDHTTVLHGIRAHAKRLGEGQGAE